MTTFHEQLYNQMMDSRRMQSKVLFVLPHRKAGQTWMKNFTKLNPNMKPILHKWQFWCRLFDTDYYIQGTRGWHIFNAGFIKLHTMPDAGQMVDKKMYKGFAIKFAWWFPIDRV